MLTVWLRRCHPHYSYRPEGEKKCAPYARAKRRVKRSRIVHSRREIARKVRN